MQLTLHLLGSFDAKLDGTSIARFYSDKVRALLIYLVVESQQAHRRTTLAGLLWPDTAESKARQSLRQALRQLRKVLHDDEVDPPFLLITTDSVQLNPASDHTLDLAQLAEQLSLATALSHDGPHHDQSQFEQLHKVLLNLGGTLVDGFHLADSDLFNEWLYFKREEMQQQIVAVLRLGIDHATARQAYDDARIYLQKWLSIEPWQEEAHRRLIQTFIAQGDQSSALAQYENCRRLLESELGVEPAVETKALVTALKAERLPASPLPTTQEPSSAIVTAVVPVEPPRFLAAIAEPTTSPPSRFVAREEELAALHEHLAAIYEGQGRICFVTGGAGRGKSALLAEFVSQAHERHPALVAAQGACSARVGMGDPLMPFREILGLLTGDVEARWAAGTLSREQALRLWQVLPYSAQGLVERGQDLLGTLVSIQPLAERAAAVVPTQTTWFQTLQQATGANTGNTPAPNQEQSALFEQYAQVLAAVTHHAPLLLTLDDMQWGDLASIELLFYLTRQLVHLPILLVIAYRDDEVALGRSESRHPLAPVLNEVRRLFGETEIKLEQDDSADGRTFIDAYLDSEPNLLDEQFRQALHHHTKGHPLFTVELLRNLQETGALYQDEDGAWAAGKALAWDVLPARVEAVIEERIARLEAALRDLLAVASVEGEEFTAQVLARLEAIDERSLIRRLSRELDRQHRLVAEAGVETIERLRLYLFRFRHILYQQHLYNGLGEMERALLHSDIGEALEELYGKRANEIAPRLAWHFAEAEDAERAIHYLLLAGDQARRLYAYQEAINHYRRALVFLRERNEIDRAARTLMKLGLTHHIAFDFRQAREAYDEGFELWRRAGESLPAALPPAPHPLRIALRVPLTLDPGYYTDDISADVIYRLFSGLVQLSGDMSVIPDVAERWQVLDGGRRYLFHLRSDVLWSDGVAVTAYDFEFAWKRVLSPEQPELKGTYLYDLCSARAFYQGDETDPATIGVRAFDDVTLEVELEAPTSYLPQLLTAATTFPVPRHVVQRYGERWTEPAHIVTNGPFQLMEWQEGVSATLERNPTYHGRFPGNVTQIALSFLEQEPEELFRQYKEDKVDTFDISLLTVREQEYARQQFAGEYLSGPLLSTTYLGFDTRRPPFDDVRVRQAFAYAMNQEALTDVAFSDVSFPATGGFVPPGMPGHSRDIGLPHDPTLARRLLCEAGYERGNFPPLEALCSDMPKLVQRAEVLWTQWFNHLEIDVTWTPLPWDTFRERIMGDIPHLWIVGWSGDYPDPDNFLRLCDWLVNSGWEHYGFEQLVESARAVTNQRERMALYRQADEILVQEVPVVPLLYKRFHYLVKPWVTTFPTSPVIRDFWREVVIEPH